MSDDIAPVKRRRNRLYVPLDVEFATDPKILAAGPLAAYLFVCALAYCKRSDKPGEVHAEQLRVLALGLPGKPKQYADTLVRVGLWTTTDDGWAIPSWLAHNLSPDQLEERKASAKAKSELGNHRRHHEQKGVKVSDCALCYPDDGSPQGTSTVPTGNVNSREVKGREVEGREGKGRESEEKRKQAVRGASSDNSEPRPTNPAAAALMIFLDHKVATECRTNEAGYRASVGASMREEWRDALGSYLDRRPNATAEELAAHVLHVPGMSVAQSEPKRDWYADPRCEHCDGDGLANTAPEGDAATYGPCHCRRAEPYPNPLATVTELRTA